MKKPKPKRHRITITVTERVYEYLKTIHEMGLDGVTVTEVATMLMLKALRERLSL